MFEKRLVGINIMALKFWEGKNQLKVQTFMVFLQEALRGSCSNFWTKNYEIIFLIEGNITSQQEGRTNKNKRNV